MGVIIRGQSQAGRPVALGPILSTGTLQAGGITAKERLMATGDEKIKGNTTDEKTVRVTPHTTFADGATYKRDVEYDVSEAFAKRNAKFLNDGPKLAEIEVPEPALPPPGGAGQPAQRTLATHPVAAETRLAVDAGFPQAGGDKGKKAAKADAK